MDERRSRRSKKNNTQQDESQGVIMAGDSNEIVVEDIPKEVLEAVEDNTMDNLTEGDKVVTPKGGRRSGGGSSRRQSSGSKRQSSARTAPTKKGGGGAKKLIPVAAILLTVAIGSTVFLAMQKNKDSEVLVNAQTDEAAYDRPSYDGTEETTTDDGIANPFEETATDDGIANPFGETTTDGTEEELPNPFGETTEANATDITLGGDTGAEANTTDITLGGDTEATDVTLGGDTTTTTTDGAASGLVIGTDAEAGAGDDTLNEPTQEQGPGTGQKLDDVDFGNDDASVGSEENGIEFGEDNVDTGSEHTAVVVEEEPETQVAEVKEEEPVVVEEVVLPQTGVEDYLPQIGIVTVLVLMVGYLTVARRQSKAV